MPHAFPIRPAGERDSKVSGFLRECNGSNPEPEPNGDARMLRLRPIQEACERSCLGRAPIFVGERLRVDAEDLEAGVVDAAELREERWRELGVVDAGPTEHLDDFEFA